MPLIISYEGKGWKAHYFSIDDFEKELPDFVEFLDSIDSTKEEVVAIIPNTGFVRATALLDTGFTGIKGFSVITKKGVESEQVNGITIKYGPMVDKGLMRCVHCGRTFVKDYDKCPYCGSSSMVLNP
ncbi:MAG: hypothetical protein QXX77_03555 [Candidatus Methanosuratincola sp.]